MNTAFASKENFTPLLHRECIFPDDTAGLLLILKDGVTFSFKTCTHHPCDNSQPHNIISKLVRDVFMKKVIGLQIAILRQKLKAHLKQLMPVSWDFFFFFFYFSL